MAETNMTTFLALNELNFELVQKYIDGGLELKNFQFILENFTRIDTYAEEKYENIEPWIQWVSVYTGLEYSEHGVFRLGESSPQGVEQLFEVLESKGYSVGAISPMNAENNLRLSPYFLPDPWSSTKVSGPSFLDRCAKMLKQTVNDNSSGRITSSSVVTILELIARTLPFKDYVYFARLCFSVRVKKHVKSLVLDYLVHKLHQAMWKKYSPDFTYLFLNAGAHTQHHYICNSPYVDADMKNPSWYVSPTVDPLVDLLIVYDRILGEVLSSQDAKLIIATGLSQQPYSRPEYYYRLRNHENFIRKIGLSPISVYPRMTRDFELKFPSELAAIEAGKTLKGVVSGDGGERIFGMVDVRGESLFATLTYNQEIAEKFSLKVNDQLVEDFDQDVVFVALKNGMHDTRGYCFINFRPQNFGPLHQPIHVKDLRELTLASVGHVSI